MNQEILKEALDVLGWEYSVRRISEGQAMYVYQGHPQADNQEDCVLYVAGNRVAYHAYDTTNRAPGPLPGAFALLQQVYAQEAVLRAFEPWGFRWQKEKGEVPPVQCFVMAAYSQLPEDAHHCTEIQFCIEPDGSVVAETFYVPQDLEGPAAAAMLQLENSLGIKRVPGLDIFQKPVPAQYAAKLLNREPVPSLPAECQPTDLVPTHVFKPLKIVPKAPKASVRLN